ncbi:MAG: dihydroorotate dehydrogenase-like protein [Haliscomenobacter sp.]|nr:dihydroorotate dehydrogenase-like protein [Haliscomenobacter sp.]MBK8877113.1 dihydroorotate dehydrogenase-like protein [Haliscomenobacter sp.]
MDLRTRYLGLDLRSPLVVSACTLSEEIDNILRMEDAGAGAVVLFSLFEEQIRLEEKNMENVLASTSNMFAEAMDYFPQLEDYHVGTSQYLEHLRMAKERTSIPIIASLNGTTPEGWINYARDLEQAGADALEVNIFYIPADIRLSASEVENRYLDIIRAVRKTVKIPLSVKLNPYFSAMGNMAARMEEAGADGLVLFNRFYQPDFDIDRLHVLSDLQYSVANEIRLPLLWIAILYGRVPVSLAATTGVQGAPEVIKYLLAGADVAMTASALYKFGIPYLSKMQDELEDWMQRMGFQSVDGFKGAMSQRNVSDPTAYERANYIRILEKEKRH